MITHEHSRGALYSYPISTARSGGYEVQRSDHMPFKRLGRIPNGTAQVFEGSILTWRIDNTPKPSTLHVKVIPGID